MGRRGGKKLDRETEMSRDCFYIPNLGVKDESRGSMHTQSAGFGHRGHELYISTWPWR